MTEPADAAVTRLARMIFDDEHIGGARRPAEEPTRQQLDELWADLPTDLGPDHGLNYYLGRARRYLAVGVEAERLRAATVLRQAGNATVDQLSRVGFLADIHLSRDATTWHRAFREAARIIESGEFNSRTATHQAASGDGGSRG